jgi:hypothetical protein
MKVLQQYSKLLGITPTENATREDIVATIKQKLARIDNLSDFDAALLDMDEIPDEGLAAQWLAGGRNPIMMSVLVKASVRTYYLANLFNDKGDAVERVTDMLVIGKTGKQIVETLRDEGYSFNEVTAAASKVGLVSKSRMAGNNQPNHMVPVVGVSKEAKTLPTWKFWGTETADLTIEEVWWTLLPEKVQELGLQFMPVYIVDVNVNIEEGDNIH